MSVRGKIGFDEVVHDGGSHLPSAVGEIDEAFEVRDGLDGFLWIRRIIDQVIGDATERVSAKRMSQETIAKAWVSYKSIRSIRSLLGNMLLAR